MSTIINVYRNSAFGWNDGTGPKFLGRFLWTGDESPGAVQAIFQRLEDKHQSTCPEETLISFLSRNGFIPLPDKETLVYI